MTPRSAVPKRIGAGAILALILTVLGGAIASPAFAHDQLISSTPADGSALDTAPADVSLQFSDDVLTVGAIILVVDDTDKTWTTGDANLNGSTVTAPLSADMPDGSYQIRWRVVSSDGHPISGIVPFTVGDVQASRPAANATTKPTSTADAAAAASDDSGTAATDQNALPLARIILIGLVGAGIAFLAFWIVTGRRARRSSTTATPSPDTTP